MEHKEALEITKKYGQEHILQFWEELSENEKKQLLNQISEIDFEQINNFLELTKKEKTIIDSKKIQPPLSLEKEDLKTFQKGIIDKGNNTISEGKVACLLVAGGQGSRLGFDGPKGCYKITPVKDKSLFQIFAEQIVANQQKHNNTIYWYIMTSVLNNDQTKSFFKENNYFDLKESQIIFFSQKTVPAIDKEGKLFLSSKHEIFMNPDGHGGVYDAMQSNGVVKHMQDNNVKYVSFVNVDNPIVDIFDSAYIGLMEENNSDFGAKTIKKFDPEEKVGLVCNVEGKTIVLEYSNISEKLTHKKDADGDLVLNAVNLNVLMIKRTFIENILEKKLLEYNVAFKQIPHISEKGKLVEPSKPNGYKFEKFVFDVMPFANNVSVIQTKREDEFAPVKNAQGNDSPLTSKLLMNRKAKKWMLNAGFDKEIIDHLDFVEISPLFALTQEDFIEKVENKIEFYENEMIVEENFYFE